MAPSAGARLGPCGDVAPAGSGGTGEVHRARAVAALSHPDVVAPRDAIGEARRSGAPIELLVESRDFSTTPKVFSTEGPRLPHLTRIEDRRDTLSLVLGPRVR